MCEESQTRVLLKTCFACQACPIWIALEYRFFKGQPMWFPAESKTRLSMEMENKICLRTLARNHKLNWYSWGTKVQWSIREVCKHIHLLTPSFPLSEFTVKITQSSGVSLARRATTNHNRSLCSTTVSFLGGFWHVSFVFWFKYNIECVGQKCVLKNLNTNINTQDFIQHHLHHLWRETSWWLTLSS